MNSKILLTGVLFLSSIPSVHYLFGTTNGKGRDPHTVKLNQGTVQGTWFYYGKEDNIYRAFMGIPYAQPPVGPLRFEPPKPIQNHCETFQATSLANSAIQESTNIFHSYSGDEDCLYLNIYTPWPSEENRDVKYPVMFWIHGGSFNTGSGGWEYYGPDYLVKENVIVVTINYRLGVFGFLCAPEWGIHGNMGLKDQREALRWVNENIEKFGGDKDRITIFGESAGAASVHYLMMDKSTEGLYQRAILQSGTALNPWAIQYEPEKRFQKLKQILKITTREELQNVSAKTLYLASTANFADQEDVRRADTSVFKPVIETVDEEGSNPEPIVTESVLKLMQEGEMPDKNMIIGFNSLEGLYALTRYDKDKDEIDNTLQDLERVIPRDAFVWQNPKGAEQLQVLDDLREIYRQHFQYDQKPEKKVVAYSHIMGDAWFLNGIYRTLKNGFNDYERKSLLFVYKLTDDSYSVFKKHMIKNWQNLEGVAHTDDLGYLFRMTVFTCVGYCNLWIANNKKAQRTHRRMVMMWTNFAKTGNPMVGDICGDMKACPILKRSNWTPYNHKNPMYLNIGRYDLAMEFFRECCRMRLWDQIYEIGLKNSSMYAKSEDVAQKEREKYSKMFHIAGDV